MDREERLTETTTLPPYSLTTVSHGPQFNVCSTPANWRGV